MDRATLTDVPAETCEYRIYLDLDNSVTGGRARVLEEMRRIYRSYPHGSTFVRLARMLQVAEVRQQIALASEFDREVEAGSMTRREAAEAYIRAVVGIGAT